MKLQHEPYDVVKALESYSGGVGDLYDRACKYIQTLSAERDALAAEVERLNQCVQWEQHRAGQESTHSETCETWGPKHYECLLIKYRALEAALNHAAEGK